MKNNEEQNLLNTLKNSLIYRMSLGSKELYHSNVWAWLIEKDPAFLGMFGFGDDVIKRVKRVGREEGNRDLSVYLTPDDSNQEPVIIIENKLKSIPNKVQLQGYQNEVGDRFFAGALTGICEPTIADEDDKVRVQGNKGEKAWDFVDYKTIAERIKEIAPNSKLDERDLATVNEYCDDIAAMDALVKQKVGETLNPFWDDRSGDWDDLGLMDLVNKVRASGFIQYFKERWEKTGTPMPSKVEQGFNNKKNTLGFFYCVPDQPTIGIQIEGDQFRRVVYIEKAGQGAENLYKEFVGSWFDGEYAGGKKKEKRYLNWPRAKKMKTKLTRRYGKYGENFVYQYAWLQAGQMSYESLFRLLSENLKIAKELSENLAKPGKE